MAITAAEASQEAIVRRSGDGGVREELAP